jgi:hypothetical protein
MADIIILSNVFKDTQDENSSKPTEAPKTNTKSSSISIFGLLLGIFAAYLSWTCNTVKGVDTVGKVIYALFAFLFGGFYLIYYLIFNRPCNVENLGKYYYF